MNYNGNLSFFFMNVTMLYISGLTFNNCGLQVSSHYLEDFVLMHDRFSHSALYAAIFMANVDNLLIINVNIFHSQGYGISILEVIQLQHDW